MKKTFCILVIMFMFSLFTSGCGNVQDVTNGVKNINDSIQNVNQNIQDINKSIQDTGNQPSPNKEDKNSAESGSKGNNNDSDEENDD